MSRFLRCTHTGKLSWTMALFQILQFYILRLDAQTYGDRHGMSANITRFGGAGCVETDEPRS